MTLTFGEVAESHVGMQQIGTMAETGFSYNDIINASKYFESKGYKTIIIHLNKFLPTTVSDKEEQKFLDIAKTDESFQAYMLIIRNGVRDTVNITTEMLLNEWDKKLYNKRRRIVQNKNARHNLNFDTYSQESNFPLGKGTTISWDDVPFLGDLRNKISESFGYVAKGLKCEGNKYYEPEKTGIGYHGDSERRKVIGVRLGKSMSLHFMWYYNSTPRGFNVSMTLNDGDIYCMSEKAVGTDWKADVSKGYKNKRYSLRHAAGAARYTKRTVKIRLENPISKDDITTYDILYRPSKSQKNPNPVYSNVSR
jgi:hypothetical protein